MNPTAEPHDTPKISAVILAGGRAERLGGVDKGLQLYRGKALIEWVLEKLGPQCDEILISANRNLETYRRTGYPVLTDRQPDFPGPLAGIAAAIPAASHPLLLVVPCDAPLFPANLARRLIEGLGDADLARVVTPVRNHPVFCLLQKERCRENLEDYLHRGERRLGQWQNRLQCREVDFPDEASFINLNIPADFG